METPRFYCKPCAPRITTKISRSCEFVMFRNRKTSTLRVFHHEPKVPSRKSEIAKSKLGCGNRRHTPCRVGKPWRSDNTSHVVKACCEGATVCQLAGQYTAY